MDVDKLFKLPDLPSAAVNKRKWNAPQPTNPPLLPHHHPMLVHPIPTLAPQERASRRRRRPSDASAEEDETYFFSDDDQEDGRFFGGGLTAEQQQILDIMDKGDPSSSTPSSVHDLPSLRKQLLRFERAINRNAEMRVKHADNPARFYRLRSRSRCRVEESARADDAAGAVLYGVCEAGGCGESGWAIEPRECRYRSSGDRGD